jgi:hypothetical protein
MVIITLIFHVIFYICWYDCREYVQQRAAAPALLIDARNQGQTDELAAVYEAMSTVSMDNVATSDSSEDLLQLLDSA